MGLVPLVTSSFFAKALFSKCFRPLARKAGVFKFLQFAMRFFENASMTATSFPGSSLYLPGNEVAVAEEIKLRRVLRFLLCGMRATSIQNYDIQ